MCKLPLQVCLALALSHSLAASSYDKYMSKAREAAARRDFALAEREYQAALREVHKNPGDMRVFLAYEGLSAAAERQRDLAAAEEYLRDALAARQQTGFGPVAELPAWLDFKQFYAGQRRWEDAAATADRLAAIWKESGAGGEPGTAQYLSAAGFFYYSAGDYAKAEERYRAALQILEAAMGESAALAQAGAKLAITLAAEDKPDEAESQFKRALAMTQNSGWLDLVFRDHRDVLRKLGWDVNATVPENGRLFHVGKGVSAPRPISHREPEYTEVARSHRIVGTVILYLEFNRAGVPVNIQVLEPLGFGLDEKAIAAVETWRFRPAVKDGQPVEVAATVEVNFRLL